MPTRIDRQLLVRQNTACAKRLWSAEISKLQLINLQSLTKEFGFSMATGDILLLGGRWYVTHAGLMRLARRRRCAGIQVRVLWKACNPRAKRFCLCATAYTSHVCKGFMGYGDADPSNVSPLVHGAEMRVAETRAVNRALRKAYGIGICSVEEIGSSEGPSSRVHKLPPESVSSNESNGYENVSSNNANGSRDRDRLCQLIRQHQLDADLVKSYAVDFCGTKTLREASREQVEKFVVHLADLAARDRSALLCQLNSYARPQTGVA